MRRGTALAVIARYPAAGGVKTRLATAIGAGHACALYRAFLQDIDARFRNGRRMLVWFFDPPGADFHALMGPGSCCVPQSGEDLGQRLHNCFAHLLREGFGRIIVIGADVPHVSDRDLDEAEEALDDADIVLGPSADGGYCLIAMRALHDVFSGIAMSTGAVLAETLAKANAARLRVHLLPESFDIDEPRDLVRLRRLLAEAGYHQRLPHTAATLAAWDAAVEFPAVK
jgi:rSAM/selenodomain-associated transferase 1